MKKRVLFTLVLLSLGMAVLSGCDKKDEKKTAATLDVVTAKLSKPIMVLHYSGAVNPLTTNAVISPVDGRIAKLDFEYGRTVKKGAVIVSLSSDTLADDFKKAVNTYLQKKDAYFTGKMSFSGTQMLYKAGVTEKSSYLDEKSTFDGKTLDYLQSVYDLQKILSKVHVDPDTVLNLSISDTKQVNQLLRKQFSDIPVKANASGIALFPIQSQDDQQNSSDNKSGKLVVGSAVKKGQSILNIGDMSGLMMSFLVSEIDVNRLKVGMAATVTGSAFPNITLKGKISSVSFQAQPNQGGDSGVSMFNVEVEVPHISVAQAKTIHVGMTGMVTINIVGKPSIMLPVAAVTQKNGLSYVTRVNANGQQKQVRVVTGNTTLNDVIILQGVQAGDKVVVHDGH
ncbi:MAG: HlyD family efflux transporter periplasmic adaptor subunit [Gammaproteobacteria bacterium]|nr:HlyD family efflux transporter periplasmic adaptor subunit [Gammaproteobacteria bacterium]